MIFRKSKILLIEKINNIPFCYKYGNFINKPKNNKLEKNSISTIIFQLKLINKCKQIYIDGTSKIYLVLYYQILNIWGLYSDINGIIPLFLIPTIGIFI